ncbi:hypothetical protein D3C81_1770840 [compost metagenome]
MHALAAQQHLQPSGAIHILDMDPQLQGIGSVGASPQLLLHLIDEGVGEVALGVHPVAGHDHRGHLSRLHQARRQVQRAAALNHRRAGGGQGAQAQQAGAYDRCFHRSSPYGGSIQRRDDEPWMNLGMREIKSP